MVGSHVVGNEELRLPSPSGSRECSVWSYESLRVKSPHAIRIFKAKRQDEGIRFAFVLALIDVADAPSILLVKRARDEVEFIEVRIKVPLGESDDGSNF